MGKREKKEKKGKMVKIKLISLIVNNVICIHELNKNKKFEKLIRLLIIYCDKTLIKYI